MHKLLFGGIAATALGLAACGTASHAHTAAPPGPAAAAAPIPQVAPTTAPATATVVLASSAKGMYLTDNSGRALYIFTSDHGATSACTGSCALHWPALVSASPLAGPGIQAGALGTANGQVANQVTYHGRLLYSFAGDPGPGTTNGLAIPGWLLVAPDGTPFGAPAPSPPMAPAPVSHPAPVQAPVTQPAPAPVTQPAPPATTPVTQNPIPQGGGGDGDGDNSGGSSDGDGNV